MITLGCVVDPETNYSHVSLCAGYGGIDLGLRRVLPSCRTILACEVEAYACAVLLSKMEEGQLDACPIWTDIKTLPLEIIPKGIFVLSGGFPCTPFSVAGVRKTDDDPRHLFPYIKDAIRSIQPRWVFLENVEGIISAKLRSEGWSDPVGTPVLLHVLRELERIGYRTAWGIFSAEECGATHVRKRVFILAKMGDTRSSQANGLPCAEKREPYGETRHSSFELANSSSPRSEVGISESEQRKEGDAEIINNSSNRRWPARPDKNQFKWEEPRLIKPKLDGATNGDSSGLDAALNRVDRLRMIGNGCCPDTVAKAWQTLIKNFL